MRRLRLRVREAFGRWSPMYLLFCAERDTVAELRHELAVEREAHRATMFDLEAHRAHHRLAVEQRERARDFAVAVVDEGEFWDEADRRFFDEGVWPS